MELRRAVANRQDTPSILLGNCPTLLAGNMSGVAASVRVWAPRRHEMALFVSFLIIVLACMASLTALDWVHGHPPSFTDWYGFILLSPIAQWLRQYRRPCYVVTDETGIAIAARRGVRALRWTDIDAAHLNENVNIIISIGAPEGLLIDLTGFASGDVKDLMIVISERAHLRWHPKTDPYMSRRGDGDWVRTASGGMAEPSTQGNPGV